MSVFDTIADSFTDEEVAATLAELRLWLGEVQPELDPYNVVTSSTLLAPLAVIITKQRRLTAAISTYGNLSLLPSDNLNETLLTELRTLQAKALGVELGAGGFATGDVRITLSSQDSTIISKGTVFSAGSLQFITTSYYQLVPEDNYSGDATERKLVSNGAGGFSAVISLTATTAGIAGNITTGTVLSTTSAIPRLLQAVADTNFVGGAKVTDLGVLVRDAFDNLVAKTMGSRDQIIALIRQQPEFSNISYMGVVGCGDPEMQRDKVGILPLGIGRCDIYAATSNPPIIREASLTAIIGESVGNDRRLTIAIGRNELPGFYRIESVKLANGTVGQVESVIRGLDSTPIFDEQVPILEKESHGTFSRFQTATVVAKVATSALGSLGPGDQLPVLVTASMVPNVAELQRFVANRARRYPGGDILVRAAVPVFLEIVLVIRSMVADFVMDETRVIERVVSHLQSRPLRTIIYGSEIVTALGDLLGDSLHVSGIEYLGTMITPDGVQRRDSGSWDFEPNFDPKDQLSPRTVAMYISSGDVRLNIERKIQAEVP